MEEIKNHRKWKLEKYNRNERNHTNWKVMNKSWNVEI